MTDSEPLYVKNSYLKEFDAKVVKNGPRFVILDRTAFYPEGGGQPTDTGTIKFNWETRKVIKVVKRGTQIYHYLDGDIPEGIQVNGELDWKRRFTHMRLHSGEHLLTGLFESEGSGHKVFSSFSQLDFQPSNIDEETLQRVWKKFDEIVDMDVPIKVYYTNRDELDVGDDERKRSFLEKIPPNVHNLRMIKIGNYALTFCMGTHVKSAGDIGHLNSLRLEPKKKRRKIIYFKLSL